VNKSRANRLRAIIKAAAWLAILLVFVVTIVPIQFRPSTGYSPNIERFGVMAVVGALFAAAYPRKFWLIVLGLLLAAAGFELLQFFAGGRHPSIRDVGFKSVGAVIGAMLGYAVGTMLAKAETLPDTPPNAAPEV
jgi:VanZ like protein